MMATETAIAWTDHTFNPWMGCVKVSDGCKHCYAETLTRNRMGLAVWGVRASRQITKSPWQNVLAWEHAAERGEIGVLGPGRPHVVFVGSLMDWAEDRPDLIKSREQMWALIQRCPHLHFQMLTKRPENIERFLPEDWGPGWPNVWLGSSIENMRVAQRADDLRRIPAIVRFISYEPALGPLGDLDLSGIDWVIFGGESGPNYRKPDGWIDWAQSMRARCASEGRAFFFKQSPAIRTEIGIELDGKIIREYPEPRKVSTKISSETNRLFALV